MSCGSPHDVDCSEVIEQVYLYLDGEIDDANRAEVREHLDECGPCLREFGLEEVVKSLVKRSCADRAPVELRTKVMMRIEAARLELRQEG
jgi:mycothiol system anti-sigma-R factor